MAGALTGFFAVKGYEILDSHGRTGPRFTLRVELLEGHWYEILSGEEIEAQWDECWECWVIVSEVEMRAPFLPDPGELKRIGMIEDERRS